MCVAGCGSSFAPPSDTVLAMLLPGALQGFREYFAVV